MVDHLLLIKKEITLIPTSFYYSLLSILFSESKTVKFTLICVIYKIGYLVSKPHIDDMI